jgi:multiple sugar transport system permease protein
MQLTLRLPNRKRIRIRPSDVLAHTILLFVALLAVLPYFWMASSSLKTMNHMFTLPVQWIPDPINWQSYVLGWKAQNFTRYFINSGFVSICITLGNMVLASLAGYSLAKFRYRGRDLFFVLILSTMMLPLEVTMVPLFLIVNRLGWQNSYQSLIIPFVVEGFGVFLMRQYMLGVPTALIEAARIDGESELGIFWKIVLPLCKPALAALAVFTFREAWDMYIWPLIIVTKDAYRTVPIATALFMSVYGTSWDQMMAIATIATIPMIVLFFLLQRAFIQGIVLSGLKE